MGKQSEVGRVARGVKESSPPPPGAAPEVAVTGDDEHEGGGRGARANAEAVVVYGQTVCGGMAAAAYASARHAVMTVPRRFWAYAAAGTAMYSSVIPFWFYGSGFLQRRHGFSVAAADHLMVVPELMLAVLSIPIGVAVDALKLSFRGEAGL